ncbi:hypothetical protein [Pseudomonas sp.]|uniref:hypothetical protein n=1 Tax=Pseudomonas sp. TaxID=306 RepID=UPI003D127FBD
MKHHFRLTLSLSANDLLILTAFVEHKYDLATLVDPVLPHPLGQRLREIANGDPTDTAFEHLVMRDTLDWDIAEVGADTVTVATRPRGASLPQVLEVLGRIAPSCLDGRIVFEPAEPAQDSAAGAALN